MGTAERAAALSELLGGAHAPQAVAAFLARMPEGEQARYLAATQETLALQQSIDAVTQEAARAAEQQREAKTLARKPPPVNFALAELKAQSGQQATRVAALKAQVQRKRDELEKAFQLELLIEKRNEIALLRRELQDATAERELLERIAHSQSHAQSVGVAAVEKSRLRELEVRFKAVKEVGRAIADERQALQRAVNAKHAQMVSKGIELRGLLARPAEPEPRPPPELSAAELTAASQRLAERFKQLGAEGEDELRLLERSKRELLADSAATDQLIEQKKLLVRRNNLRIKDARKAQLSLLFKQVVSAGGASAETAARARRSRA